MKSSVPESLWIILALIGAVPVYYLFQIGRRKKEIIRFKVKRAAMGLLGYVFGIFIAIKTGHAGVDSVIFGFVLGIAVGFLIVSRPKKTRRIPKHIKRAVIRRDLGDVPYDSKIHHIHHEVPFAKDGDTSVVNLKVISKEENLKRGARMPRLRDLL